MGSTSTVAPSALSASATAAATSTVDPARVAYVTRILFIILPPIPGTWSEPCKISSLLEHLSVTTPYLYSSTVKFKAWNSQSHHFRKPSHHNPFSAPQKER